MSRIVAVLLVVLGLSACGGSSTGDSSSGGSGGGGSGGSGGNTWTAGVYQPSSSFAQRCVSPRAGTSDVSGTVTDQNNFLRSWTNELYLWYSEVTDVNPALYTTPDFFNTQKTMATTASGNPKDKFHFTESTTAYNQLSQAGVAVSYGLQFTIVQQDPPREIRVAYVEPSTSVQPTNPALSAGLARGARVVTVDGVSVDVTDQASIDTLNAGLSPATAGESHTFSLIDAGAVNAHTVTLQAASITEEPVQNVEFVPVNSTQVGYLLFNSHIATSEQELIDAVNTLKAQVISDLVLDIRYNGGGYLDIASDLAYMIAGPTMTSGQTFDQIQFNAKHPTTDPVTGQTLTPTLFHPTTQKYGSIPPAAGIALPSLNLNRVFVLTGPDTCSASEAIINGLRGVGVQVIQIGSTTCGKPYGFYPQDNCGTTYFSIQFQSVNAMNFGGYADGFSPQNLVPTPLANVALPGCWVDDDFAHALGDRNESLLNAALGYKSSNGACPVPPSSLGNRQIKHALGASGHVTARSPLRENMIL